MPHELLTRRATLEPATVDEGNRTVQAVWSTGAGVQRRDAAGPYEERLSLDPKHVDVAGLVGAPVLDGHRQESVDRILGIVAAAHVDGSAGHATLKFSERADAVWRDVVAGILRSVSVGYSVQRWADSFDPRTQVRVRTAVQWSPRELSLVAIPADAGATVRGENMEDDDLTPTPETATRATTNAEIRRLVAAAHLDRTAADSLIDREATIEEARSELLDAVLARQTPAIRHQRIDVGTEHGAPEQLVSRMGDALYARMSGTAPTEPAREYMHRRLVDLAADLLEARGERTRMLSPDQIFTRAGMLATGDFPTLLTSTGNRVLLQAFEAAPNPLRTLARRSTVNDFRSKTIAKLSEAASLSLVNEHGELTYGARTEAKEAYKIATYGKLFAITRQALINDDLGAFSDFAGAAGRAAAETEAGLLVSLLTQASGVGPTLDDGNALFHSAHGNLAGSGGTISATTLSAARLAMRSQTGITGVPINAQARYILVSATKETEAEQALAAIYAAVTANANVFAGQLTLLVEPRLSGNPWYLFSDPGSLPVLEFSYLSSAQGPQMLSRPGFETLGYEFRVTLDYGCGVIDWRGAYRNPGA